MRPYKFAAAALLLASFFFVSAHAQAHAQAVPSRNYGLEPGEMSTLDLTFSYAYFHANAPATVCGCFALQGGAAGLVVNFPHALSFVADLSSAHASAVNGTAQNITIFDYLVGPRLSYRSSHRTTPYLQVLIGGSQETSNYAAVHDVHSFAWSGGLGFTTVVTRHLAWNVVEADYIYSELPNGTNNFQQDLRLSSGLTLRFGPR
jgi:outer membrane immunogenic protein